MERRWLWRVLILVHLVALPTVGVAAEIRLERIASTSQGFLFVELEFVDAFEGLYIEAIQSGVPSTLHYTLEVWRQRSGWWDRLERTQERQFRIFRDVLGGDYWLVTEEESQIFSTFEALVTAATRFRQSSQTAAMPLPFPSADLASDKEYYLVLTANLAPLSVEDLDELDEWLKGTIRGRSSDNDTGLISGLSRTMGGLLLSLTGFGDRTVRARSPRFIPESIPLEPIVFFEPEPVDPAEPPLHDPAMENDSTQVERNQGGPDAPNNQQPNNLQELNPRP